MSGREALVRDAFAALDGGDLRPLATMCDPELRWLGVPQGDEIPECPNRAAAIDVMARHLANGRHFAVREAFSHGDRVAVGLTISDPRWSAPVETFKVFTFRPGTDVAVQLNDCVDESYARQLLAG